MKKRQRDASYVQWLLGDTTLDDFVTTKSKNAFVVHGLNVDGVWSTTDMLEVVATKSLTFNVDLNVVKYSGGKRVSYPKAGHVDVDDLRKAMKDGWSVRFLRPHEHVARVSHIIHHMEEQFLCHCGANTYWTPAESQGFAPHFDDVDVFIVQTEGEKHWLVYKCEVRPRFSSEDFSQEDLPHPDLEVVLRPGDMLYLPRGYIHQAKATSKHSLHITFSSNQCNTFADYLHTLFRTTVESLAADDVEVRETLPLGITEMLGATAELTANRHSQSPMRTRVDTDFCCKITKLVGRVQTLANSRHEMNLAMDNYVKATLPRRQPPVESARTTSHVTLDTLIRPVTRTVARMVMEAGECRVYYCSVDAREMGSLGPELFLRFDKDFAPAVAHILTTYPKFARVGKLPMDSDEFTDEDANENRIVLARMLLDTKAFTARE